MLSMDAVHLGTFGLNVLVALDALLTERRTTVPPRCTPIGTHSI